VALVVGLGNPGTAYADTRHNAGWWVVGRLVRRWGASAGEGRSEYRTWDAMFRGSSVTLLEPLTWMNRSGEAIVMWREGHGLEPSQLLVVVDDVYLPVGHLRLRASGSNGGHRGLASIERALGTRDYARLRVGVGAAAAPELREHVLDAPPKDELEALERAADGAAEAVECWLAEGVIMAMNRINRRVPKEVSEP
jgi:PTH1 family peptidyl-tRNA hydrolase